MPRKAGTSTRRGWSAEFGTYGSAVQLVELHGEGKELYVIISPRKGRKLQKVSLGVGGLRDLSGTLEPARVKGAEAAGRLIERALREETRSLSDLIAEAQEMIGPRPLPCSGRVGPAQPSRSFMADRLSAVTGRMAVGEATPEEIDEAQALIAALAVQGPFAGRRGGVVAGGRALTLAEGIDRYFTPGTGAFAAATTDLQDRRTCLARLLPELRDQVVTWNDLEFRHVEAALQACVLRIARDLAAPPLPGAPYPYKRTLERAVQTVRQIATWLTKHRHARCVLDIDLTWKDTVRKHYRAVFTALPTQRDLPRVHKDAFQALMRAFADPTVEMDPRLRGQVLTGAERRPGQVVVVMRRDLCLHPMTGVPERLNIPGTPEKPGVPVVFERVTATYWADALATGHLRVFEAAYVKDGRDYPLFPGGTLPADGAAFVPTARTMIPMQAKRMLAMFKALVREHPEWGIDPSVPGFGFYALKRTGAAALKQDGATERTKDAVTGHLDATTRARHYEGKFDEADLAAAAEARERIRGYAPPADRPRAVRTRAPHSPRHRN